MASVKDTASFFANGNSKQFEYCIKLYPQVLKLKADKRSKKPEELVRLDNWYQNELPKKIKQRGKDAHMVHEELVQTMRWKQSRGKFYPQLSYLIKVNTPRAVMQETKKAFKKLPNLEQAITALSNLKGVGTTMASALLAAAAPDHAPFMADECLMAIPEIEGIDYTTKEYLNFVQHIQTTVNRLNAEKDSNQSWSPHRVELALWSHFVASDLKPELLDDLPDGIHSSSTATTTTVVTSTTNGVGGDDDFVRTAVDTEPEENSISTEDSSSQDPIQNNTTDEGTTPNTQIEPSDESNLEPPTVVSANGNNGNGVIDSIDESTRSEDSLEKPITPIATDGTNESDSFNLGKRPRNYSRNTGAGGECDSSEDPEEDENDEEEDEIESSSEPEIKKLKSEN